MNARSVIFGGVVLFFGLLMTGLGLVLGMVIARGDFPQAGAEIALFGAAAITAGAIFGRFLLGPKL